MHTVKIFYKIKTPLIEALLKNSDIKEIKPHSLFKKLMLSPKKYPDIFFHQGKLENEAWDMIKNSQFTIVNSNSAKEELIQKTKLNAEKFEVIYPCFTPQEIDIKEAKKDFLKQLNLDKKTKIILFTANNLKSNGVKEFINTILNLQSTNYRVIIASDTQQITNLKFQISKYNFGDNVFLYENFEDINLLFAISDIFVLPTHNQAFASNILKAMYYKTAVFVTSYNASSELVDVFATMNLPNDPSTAFKIDALLSRNEDLKTIKKQNHKIAKQYTLEKELRKMEEIVKLLNKS